MEALEKKSIKNKFDSMDNAQIERYLDTIYEKAYQSGRDYERKITQRVKLRYNALVFWFIEQLSQFHLCNKTYPSQRIVNRILEVADEYVIENNLFGMYSSGKDLKEQLSELLPNVIGEHLKKE
jgi:hypothetical protein